MNFLQSELVAGKQIQASVVLLVAHQDDETIALGGCFSQFDALTLIHATNGAPNDIKQINNVGFDSAAAYSAARFSELEEALRAAGARPVEQLRYNYSDQELVFHLRELIDRLEVQLRGASFVITHPYEGGHPDHDACALAVQYATQRLTQAGLEAPRRLEFAGYLSFQKRLYTGSFWPDYDHPEFIVRLTQEQRRRKKEAFAAFTTQQYVLKDFSVEVEKFRDAPQYDFRRPPPPSAWLYDNHGWKIKGADWMSIAGQELDRLGVLNPSQLPAATEAGKAQDAAESPAIHFDIVMACDFRVPGGVASAMTAEIRAFSGAGLKIGLLQIDSQFPFESLPELHPDIRRCIESGLAKWVSPSQSVDCDLLALHEAWFFQWVDSDQPIRARNRIVVAHSVPLGAMGEVHFDPWRLDRNLRKHFGGEFIWAPISPVCRKQFHAMSFDHALLADNWHNIVKVEDWGAPRLSPKFQLCVIGRHSRSYRDKWPPNKAELLLCYPPDSDFEVRILGADLYLKNLVGLVPENWHLFAYNEIPPTEFLQTIDFFVYFHHPSLLEGFGRGPAEAAAAGCVLVLPHYLEATFGDGAVYCEPHEVAATVRRLHADSHAYALQSRRGYDVVHKRYGSESLVRLAKATIAQPKIEARPKSGLSGHVKDLSRQLALRSRFLAREVAPSPKQFLRRAFWFVSARIPGGFHQRVGDYLLDRWISRSPDRAILLDQIFPALAEASALPANSSILWIGCRRYTKGYYSILERQGAKCWTLDIDPEIKKWGRRGRHKTGDMTKLAELFPGQKFDTVLCNGVLGWGVDSPADQVKAFESMAAVTKPGSWMLIGWNTDRIDDPVKAGYAEKSFDIAALPSLPARYVVGDGSTHVYDTFRRRADA